MENGLQNGLKCVLRYIDFYKIYAGGPRTPLMRGEFKTPLILSPPPLAAKPSRLSPLGSRLRLSVPPATTSLGPALKL